MKSEVGGGWRFHMSDLVAEDGPHRAGAPADLGSGGFGVSRG
jgi:hypothetical protein